MRKLVLAVALAVLANLGNAQAQTYPSRPVHIIVPFGAGSVPDIVARILAPHLSEDLGQPVIVENVAGAGGMTGVHRVVKAPPDTWQSRQFSAVVPGTGPRVLFQGTAIMPSVGLHQLRIFAVTHCERCYWEART
jgi:tripartite-type tricarboxylate transporter receptor subunit TctC